MKYWLKRCPKCSGDLREESNTFGSYISCVQCGYVLTFTQEAAILATGTLDEPQLRVEEPQHHVAPGAEVGLPKTPLKGARRRR